jgi:hypothetical protein
MLGGTILMAFLLAGCQAVPMTTPIVFDTDPAPKVVRKKARQAVKKEVEPAEPMAVRGPVTLFVSSDTPAYRAVAEAFIRHWGIEVRTVWLDQEPDTDKLIHELEVSPPQAVVAIGEPALAVLSASSLPVIHAQSFQDNQSSRGVDSMPNPAAQLRAWVAHEPTIHRIGIITGASFGGQMQALADAGAALGLEMTTRQVSSDKEVLFEFRRLVPALDGFIFLPDDSVLSPGVIQEIISHGRRNGIQFLAYNRLLQTLGAQYLVTQDAEDVAAGLVQLINNPAHQTRTLTSFYLHDKSGSQRIDVDG